MYLCVFACVCVHVHAHMHAYVDVFVCVVWSESVGALGEFDLSVFSIYSD